MEQAKAKQVIRQQNHIYKIAESEFDLCIENFDSVPMPFTSITIEFPEIDAVW